MKKKVENKQGIVRGVLQNIFKRSYCTYNKDQKQLDDEMLEKAIEEGAKKHIIEFNARMNMRINCYMKYYERTVLREGDLKLVSFESQKLFSENQSKDTSGKSSSTHGRLMDVKESRKRNMTRP